VEGVVLFITGGMEKEKIQGETGINISPVTHL